MKLISAAIIVVALMACKNTGKRYHDGTYVYTDTSGRIPYVQKITVDGKWIYHTVQSTKENSSAKKYKMLCIQYPDKITLPLIDGHSVIVEVDNSNNLIYDGHLFKKEPSTGILLIPAPKVFQETKE